jgi:hypothetical protein
MKWDKWSRDMTAPRRPILIVAALLLAGFLWAADKAIAANGPARRVPLIDCTDLYHPHQDPGDNLDLVAPYALPEIDLKAVILDVTQQYRTEGGRRDAGFVPVLQLNSIFNRNVPCGVTPYAKMKSPDDPMLGAPRFQQSGVELLLKILREASEPVEIASFGSVRAIALAYNREPDLLKKRVKRIHVSAGASELGYLEWNVVLDPQALVRLLRSDLPIAIYPCATKEGPFAYGPHNSFWQLNNLKFIEKVQPPLRAYLAFAFSQSNRMDFLQAMEEAPPPAVLGEIGKRTHRVWETAVWIEMAHRRLVRRADGHFRIIPAGEVKPGDTVLPNELRPVRITVRDDGQFTWEPTAGSTNFWMYDRGDPRRNEEALREALPALYESFRP